MVISSDDEINDDGVGCGCDENDSGGCGCDEDDNDGCCGCDENDVGDMVIHDEIIVASVSARSTQQSRLLGNITSASTTKSNNRDCRADAC